MFRRLRRHSAKDDIINSDNNVENNPHRSALVSSRSASEGNMNIEARGRVSLPPFSEALTRRRGGARSWRSISNPTCSISGPRRRRRRRVRNDFRIEQLVANEIESILLDQDLNQNIDDPPPLLPPQRRQSRRNSKRRVSFSSLRSMRSIQIGSTTAEEQELQLEQQQQPSASVSTNTNNTTRAPRHRQSINDDNDNDDSLPDSDTINIYSLFGGDSKKSCSTSTGGGEKTAVIYAKDYPIAVAPLFVFLACMFIILLVVRILVNLLTMAMGSMAIVLGAAALIEFLRHPLLNARNLLAATHHAPVLVFGGLGGFLGACRVMYVHGRRDEASVLWGLLEGLVYGIEWGALWLVVFGDASDHSRMTLWMVQGWERLCDCCHVVDDNDDNDNDTNTTNTRSCMICLETCRDKRQLLPCLHGFHPDCLEQWLLVKPSCPICRVAIRSPPMIPMTIEEQGCGQCGLIIGLPWLLEDRPVN
jgi:hypothetical protein